MTSTAVRDNDSTSGLGRPAAARQAAQPTEQPTEQPGPRAPRLPVPRPRGPVPRGGQSSGRSSGRGSIQMDTDGEFIVLRIHKSRKNVVQGLVDQLLN